jgi:hypothetical protein
MATALPSRNDSHHIRRNTSISARLHWCATFLAGSRPNLGAAAPIATAMSLRAAFDARAHALGHFKQKGAGWNLRYLFG